MQVARWGNSLAIRLPAAVVEVLSLKEGDEIEVHVAGEREFAIARKPGRDALIARLRAWRGRLPADFRFDEGLGRREGRLFGGEESDFARRVRALGLAVVYVGAAEVTHLIEPERTRLPWILKRLVYAGHGRALAGGTPEPGGKARLADWLLLPLYLPPYALGWLWGKLSRQPAG